MDKLKFNGELVIYKKKHDFEFDGKQLKITLKDKEEADQLLYTKDANGAFLFCGGNAFPSEYIKGTIYPSKKEVIFNIQREDYSCSDFMFASEIKYIYVSVYRYIIISNLLNKSNKTVLSYKSKHFHHFLGLIPRYKAANNNRTNSILDVSINSDVINYQKVFFNYRKVKYEIEPNCSYRYGVGEFNFIPELTIKTSKKYNLKELMVLYRKICNMVKFLFLRTNIYPNEFVAYTDNKEYKIYEREWDIFKEKDENLKKPDIYDSVLWSIIYKNGKNIFIDFLNDTNDDLIFNLYKNKQERYAFDRNAISSDAAEFEHIFNIVFPKYKITSKKKQREYNEVRDTINNLYLTSSGKKKEIYSRLLKDVDRASLKDKILFSLNKYKNILNSIGFLKRHIHDYNEIADICSSVRNDIDHGNEGIIIDKNKCEYLIYMRVLIYIMYYKKWGFSNKEVSSIISSLFSYMH